MRIFRGIGHVSTMLKQANLLFFALFFASPLLAQHWTKITATDTSGLFQAPRVPYFLDSARGFFFHSGCLINNRGDFSQNSDSARLLSTTDGGTTWSSVNFFDSIHVQLAQLYFISKTHGFAATFADPRGVKPSCGLFETSDFGHHWNRIATSRLGFNSVYAAMDGSLFATIRVAAGSFGPLIYSHDQGKTWDTLTNVVGVPIDGQDTLFELVYGNRDSLIASIYIQPLSTQQHPTYQMYLVYSTDLGAHWNSNKLDSAVWPAPHTSLLHISPHSCTIIRAFDTTDKIDETNFYKLEPPYTTWQHFCPPVESGRWLAGGSCAMYLAHTSDGWPGVGDGDSMTMVYRGSVLQNNLVKPLHFLNSMIGIIQICRWSGTAPLCTLIAFRLVIFMVGQVPPCLTIHSAQACGRRPMVVMEP
jgi:hypothetical protein